tara:strand:- start:590 stop:1207 length:618 start_codon:yes stop_codon:yes gene_type:complete
MMNVNLRNDEITALLRTHEPEPGDEGATEGSAALNKGCDVSYVLFLEPREEPDPTWTALEWVADAVIKRFSPPPTISHCELVAPPIPSSSGGRVHFATYLSRAGADWQNKDEGKDEGISFYLIDNGSRWRALPVFGPDAAAQVRAAAQNNLHSPYSISMYLTSARGANGSLEPHPNHIPNHHCSYPKPDSLTFAVFGRLAFTRHA